MFEWFSWTFKISIANIPLLNPVKELLYNMENQHANKCVCFDMLSRILFQKKRRKKTKPIREEAFVSDMH